MTDELVIRPPSEANSIILQATRGCSHNKCNFCGVYKNVRFAVRSEEEITQQLHFAQRYNRHQNRLFIGAGDALILPQKTLLGLCDKISTELPWVNRISLYANGKSIRSKSDRELLELKQRGLDRVYLGVESGDDYLLEWMRKGETAESLISAGRRVVELGFFLSTTILLGIGGVERSLSHARATAELLNKIKPNQIAALALMVIDGTELAAGIRRKEFVELSAPETVSELKELITWLSLDRVQFMANHSSNFVPLSGRLQRDKQHLLQILELALADHSRFVPGHLRAL